MANAVVKVGSSGKKSKTKIPMTTSALDFVTDVFALVDSDGLPMIFTCGAASHRNLERSLGGQHDEQHRIQRRKRGNIVKKLIVFDLDGTLAESKSAVDPEMSGLLHDLLGIVKVAVISGGGWPQFEKQVISKLPHDERLRELSLLPTCGTKFYQYSGAVEKTL